MSDIAVFLTNNWFTLFLLGLVFVTALFFVFTAQKSQYIIYALLVWFPLETLILRYTPLEYHPAVKYFPEFLLYASVFFSWLRYAFSENSLWPKNPLNKPLLSFILVSAVSLVLNWYSPAVWALGLRQLLRFALVFFFILLENYPREIKFNFLKVGGVMILLEALLGILQYALGGAIDQYLFFSEAVNIGRGARLGAIEQFWAPGSRVFATLGRYDRLGSFLALGLIAFFPLIYILKKPAQKWWYAAGFFVIALALVLTSSRASWLMALSGLLTIGIIIMKDERVKAALAVFSIALVAYLGFYALLQGGVTTIVDKPVQSFSERIWEAVSFRSYKEGYEGYGRIFFIVNTPLVVVRDSPFFGVGLGNYGGGVAATLLNYEVYDRLHLPFGIQNIYGQIDNNWMSIWGETGAIGLICFIVLFLAVYRSAREKTARQTENWDRAFARGLCGAVAGIAVVGFFGPYFEFRALMFYFWMLAGCVIGSKE